MTLQEIAESVQTREDLVRFLAALKDDFVANRHLWTNTNLHAFLEAMVGWSQDMDGFYRNRGEEISLLSPWRIMADSMMAARIYE